MFWEAKCASARWCSDYQMQGWRKYSKVDGQTNQISFITKMFQLLKIRISNLHTKGKQIEQGRSAKRDTSFFHIFVIILLIECEKSWQPHMTEHCC